MPSTREFDYGYARLVNKSAVYLHLYFWVCVIVAALGSSSYKDVSVTIMLLFVVPYTLYVGIYLSFILYSVVKIIKRVDINYIELFFPIVSYALVYIPWSWINGGSSFSNYLVRFIWSIT